MTIATAEQTVATTQNQQAQATLQLLTTQFTNPDLYKWMSDTLGGVYRYFLQQATATARLAQAQLAFERAEPAQAFVRLDYWQPPAQLAASAAPGDTRGMTGAEQLAEDLSQLDQYAFTTDTRRLNLSQTFSLAQLLPVEFLGFLRTGQISFATPMSWFDRDFPGHYQRLIRQVRVSVVALVPPARGIRATLSSSGISRVTTASNGTFSQVTLRRDPHRDRVHLAGERHRRVPDRPPARHAAALRRQRRGHHLGLRPCRRRPTRSTSPPSATS